MSEENEKPGGLKDEAAKEPQEPTTPLPVQQPPEPIEPCDHSKHCNCGTKYGAVGRLPFWQKPSWFWEQKKSERVSTLATFLGIAVVVAGVIIATGQWREMAKTTSATKDSTKAAQDALGFARGQADKDSNARAIADQTETTRFNRSIAATESSVSESKQQNERIVGRMDKSLEVAHGTERPWLSIKQWSSDHLIRIAEDELSTPRNVKIDVQNVGKTPAFKVSYVCQMDASPYPTTKTPPPETVWHRANTPFGERIISQDCGYELRGDEAFYWLPYKTLRYPLRMFPIIDSIAVVAPGSDFKISCKTVGNFGAQITAILEGHSHIYAHGWISYFDAVHKERQTHFCLEFGDIVRFPEGRFESHPCPEWCSKGQPLNDAN